MSVIDNHRYPWPMRPLLAWLNRDGQASEAVLLWARQPLAFMGFVLMGKALDKDQPPLSRALRNLVRVRVAQLNRCEFCVALNSRQAKTVGVADPVLDGLANFATDPQFNATEKYALAYAEAMTLAQPISDELTAQLKRAFGDDGLVALTAVIAHQNLSAKFNAALGAKPQNSCLIDIPD